MSTSARPGVLLDVDGTLLDTRYLQALAWWQAFRDVGVAGVTMADTHRAAGTTIQGVVDRLAQEADDRTKARVVKRHTKRYARLQDQVVAFSGADHLVRRCHDAGFRVVLTTSGPRSDLGRMLATIGVGEEVLAGSTTSDDVAEGRSAPDLVTAAVRRHDLDPARTAAVGDTVWDVRGARAAGVRNIGLTCGGFAAYDLSAAGADEIFDGPADLVDRWDDSLLARLG